MEKMRILFLFISVGNLNDEFPGLYGELIQEFKKQGNDVYVATIAKNNKTQIGTEGDIPVLRINNHNPVNYPGVKKALSYMELTVRYLMDIPKYFKGEKFDWIVYHTLPPELGLILPRLKKRFGAKGYLIVSDTQWQGAVGEGMYGKNSPICYYYRFAERQLLKNTNKFCVPSLKNFELVKKSLPSLDLNDFIIANWWAKKSSAITADKAYFAKKYNLPEGFWVIYGGNMGIAQKDDTIMELAKRVRENKDIKFLLLLNGAGVEKFKQEVYDNKLDNIIFLNFMPREDYIKLLVSCDVGMILLKKTVVTPSIPSKTVTYYQLSIPILASINPGNDLKEIIERDGSGFVVEAGDIAGLTDNLLRLYSDNSLRCRIKGNIKKVFEERMEVNKVYKMMEKQMRDGD